MTANLCIHAATMLSAPSKIAKTPFETTRDMLAKTEGGELLVHIGLDFGDLIRVLEDIFGDCVKAAARFSSLANANEAICSELLRSKVNSFSQAELTFFDTLHLKGKRDAANVYRYAFPNLDMGTQIFFGKRDGLSATATTPPPHHKQKSPLAAKPWSAPRAAKSPSDDPKPSIWFCHWLGFTSTRRVGNAQRPRLSARCFVQRGLCLRRRPTPCSAAP